MANPITFRRSRGKNGSGSPWLDDTIKLIKRATTHGISYYDIYHSTGVLPNWISMVVCGRITDPSIRRVQAVHDFLLDKMRHK